MSDGGPDVATVGPDSPLDGPPEDGSEPIELLVRLAEEDEIDPWDIDIVDVTDEFLNRLDDGDLRRTGRALFYASVLLRMKSEAIVDPDPQEDPDPETGPPLEFEGRSDPSPGPAGDPLASLEDELDRRLERKRAREAPKTLDELIRELRRVERSTLWKESRSYDTVDSPRGFDRGVQRLDYHETNADRAAGEPTEEDVTERAHGEDIEAIIADIWTVLETHFDAGRDEVLFKEIDGVAESRVQTFLGLLFLAHRDRVELDQSAIFEDLWIRRVA